MDGSISTPTSTRTRVPLVGVAIGAGATDPGCREGPAVLRNSGAIERLCDAGLDPAWHDIEEPRQNGLSTLEAVARTCEALSPLVRDGIRSGERPVVIGGDHSCAIGTWSGVHHAFREQGPHGLIWVDAHMDSHVPETSPSGKHHGMPLAVLMGHGDHRLTALTEPGPALRPEHLCLVGVRSYEREEAAFLARQGVVVYFMEDVIKRGLHVVLEEATAIAANGTVGFSLSIDLDAIDPADAPGVGLPEPNGIRAAELVDALGTVPRIREFEALELVEFNPSRDHDNKTRDLLETLIATAIRVG